MIYTSYDYISKYQEVLCYLLSFGIKNKYSFQFIEKTIAHSEAIKEFERSNITLIAFSSCQMITKEVYKQEDVFLDSNDIFGVCGWLSTIYIRLFLKLKMTFEALFLLFPIKEGIECYPLYHEMDISQIDQYIDKKMDKTILDIVMKNKKKSNLTLAQETGLSVATINALRYGHRDIKKLESYKLLILASSLNVYSETIIGKLPLQIK